FDDMLDSAVIDLSEAHAQRVTDPQVRVQCLDAEGQYLVAAGKADSGIVLLRRAVAASNEKWNASDRLAIMNDLAEAYRFANRPREGLPYHRQVVAELDSSGFGTAEQVPNTLTFLVGSLWELGEYAAADSEIGVYVREQEAANGPGRISTLLALEYGRNKVHLGQLDSAERWLSLARRDTTQGAGMISIWLPFAMTELRLEQGRIADAKHESASLGSSARGQTAITTMLRARIQRAGGDTAGASKALESELAMVANDGKPALTHFAMPYVYAAMWRLDAGDARGADSLARLGLRAALVDAVAASRSAMAGEAYLMIARTQRSMGNLAASRDAERRAEIALANGYGRMAAFPRHDLSRASPQPPA